MQEELLQPFQVQCALDGATSISIFNPDDPFLDRAKGTAAKLKNEVPDCNVQVFCLDDPGKLKEEIEKADILVNGTLVGMKPHEDRSPITDKSVFRSDLIVCDVVYNPEETKLLREAKEAGCDKNDRWEKVCFCGRALRLINYIPAWICL